MDSLLDTNVISQRTKLEPHAGVLRWLGQARASGLYLSAISLAEIRFGIEEMQAGRKRRNFEHWLENDLRQGFAGRILPIDERIAQEAGRLTSVGKQEGARPQLADALIAATALIHGMQLATLNRNHFKDMGLELVEF